MGEDTQSEDNFFICSTSNALQGSEFDVMPVPSFIRIRFFPPSSSHKQQMAIELLDQARLGCTHRCVREVEHLCVVVQAVRRPREHLIRDEETGGNLCRV